MRALILVAGAALAVSACSSNDAADNTTNVDENLASENMMMNDTTAVDSSTNMDSNMAADANMSMNASDANMSMNSTGNMSSNNAM